MKKKKLKLKKSFINILIICGLIMTAIYYMQYVKSDEDIKTVSNNSKLETIGYDNKTTKYINEKLTSEEIKELEDKDKIENLDLFITEKYYLHKNLERYLNYYTTHPDLQINKIIALVNVSADKEGYKDPKKADLSKGILILVNKYNALDENYEPEAMLDMSLTYAYEGRKIKQEVNDAFIKMAKDAKKDDIDLFVTSAYRSYSYQSKLYSNYVGMYGADYANTVSAMPGFSEHQTGLALDILTPGIQMSEFKNTKAYTWLKDNSYKYGFILRYPNDKIDLTGYAFESWHYRYLGEEMAQKVYNEDITYDEYYAFYLDK